MTFRINLLLIAAMFASAAHAASTIWSCELDSGNVLKVTGDLNDWGDRTFNFENAQGSQLLEPKEADLQPVRSFFCGPVPGHANGYALLHLGATTLSASAQSDVTAFYSLFEGYDGKRDCGEVAYQAAIEKIKPIKDITVQCQKSELAQLPNLVDVSGGLDSTFGKTGILQTTLKADENPRFLFSRRDGSMLVTGDCGRSICLWTADAAGSAFDFFESSPIPLPKEVAGYEARLLSAAIDPGDTYLILYLSLEKGHGNDGLAIAKFLLSERKWDAKFANQGVYAVTNKNPRFHYPADGLAVSKAGEIYFGGQTAQKVGDSYVRSSSLLKLTPSGKVDSAFESSFKKAKVWSFPVGRILVEPDGKVVYAGTSGYGGGHFAVGYLGVTRLTASGTVDPTFGKGGTYERNVGRCHGHVSDLLRRTNGNFVAATTCEAASQPSNQPIVVYSIASAGVTDPGFNAGEALFLNHRATYNSSDRYDRYGSLGLLTKDGRIIFAASEDGIVSHSQLASLISLDERGTPTPTFGKNGRSILRFENKGSNALDSVWVASDAQGRVIQKSVRKEDGARLLTLTRILQGK